MNNDPFCGGRKLPLVEDFYTIQGEGFHAGKPAYFIRLGGCDVGCRWCDAKMTWNPRLYPPVEVDSIVERACSYPAQAIVITLALSAGLSDGAADGTGSRNIPRNLGCARTDRPFRLDLPLPQKTTAPRRQYLSESPRTESDRRKRGRLPMGRDQRRPGSRRVQTVPATRMEPLRPDRRAGRRIRQGESPMEHLRTGPQIHADSLTADRLLRRISRK